MGEAYLVSCTLENHRTGECSLRRARRAPARLVLGCERMLWRDMMSVGIEGRSIESKLKLNEVGRVEESFRDRHIPLSGDRRHSQAKLQRISSPPSPPRTTPHTTYSEDTLAVMQVRTGATLVVVASDGRKLIRDSPTRSSGRSSTISGSCFSPLRILKVRR
jgi:hypothetical protein